MLMSPKFWYIRYKNADKTRNVFNINKALYFLKENILGKLLEFKSQNVKFWR